MFGLQPVWLASKSSSMKTGHITQPGGCVCQQCVTDTYVSLICDVLLRQDISACVSSHAGEPVHRFDDVMIDPFNAGYKSDPTCIILCVTSNLQTLVKLQDVSLLNHKHLLQSREHGMLLHVAGHNENWVPHGASLCIRIRLPTSFCHCAWKFFCCQLNLGSNNIFSATILIQRWISCKSECARTLLNFSGYTLSCCSYSRLSSCSRVGPSFDHTR